MNIVNISTLDPAAFLLALGATLLAFVTACTGTNAGAADLYSFTATPLKAPDCVLDPSSSFFAQNTPQVNAPHPTLPIDRFYLIVRYLGDDAVTYAPSFDFARIPESYGYVPFRGLAVTDLSVPDAKSTWQRARRPDADLDNSSAFQMHCFEAASFINSWMFPYKVLTGGGPHAIYGYSFNHPSPPAIFDGDSNTDLVLQASVEIPFVVTWPDPTDASRSEPIGQVVVFAYFRDRGTGKTFALLLGVFDNRFSATPEYAPFVAHDGDTPFVSAPLSAGAVYATLSTFSATFTGKPWTGLRFFRAHITQNNFHRALADVNDYCRLHSSAHSCELTASIGAAYSTTVTDYELTDFGVIHEVFRDGPNSNISMGVHIYGLGAWNFR